MSRRNDITEPDYGQIKLKCPHGHPVGVIMVQPRRPVAGRTPTLLRLTTVMKAPELIAHPDGKLDPAPGSERVPVQENNPVHEWGRTVGADCEICGRPYWTFWETVEPAIARLANTPVVTLTLDDDPLC